MKFCVADLEADGLLEDATKVWCGVFIDYNTKEKYVFRPHEITNMLTFMDSCTHLCFHNGFGYDFPLLEKLYGYEYKGKKLDTMVISRYQNTDMKKPIGYKGKAGPHSIEAWGFRLGRYKPDHEDWSQFSEEMLHRCIEDTEILDLTLSHLIEEGKEYGWGPIHKNLNFQVFDIVEQMTRYGWLVDKPYMEKMHSLLDHWINRIVRVLDNSLPYVIDGNDRKEQLKGKETYNKKPFKMNGDLNVKTTEWAENNNIPKEAIAGPFSRIIVRRLNALSADEMKIWLLDQGWEPAEWNYKEGKDGWPLKDENGNKIKSSPKLNYKDPFNGVEGKIGKIASKMFQCKHRKSLIKGLIKRIRPDGRVSQYISGLTNTNRMIHNGIVNIPNGGSFFGKQCRQMFISKPGYKIVGVDSAGCQNRMKAARVGDPQYTKTLLEGKKEDKTSIHWVNLKNLADAGIDVTYSQAKNLDYGMAFGSMDKGLGAQLGGDAALGARIRKALLGVAPGLADLVEKLTAEWRSNANKTKKWGKDYYSNGWVRGLDGRPIHIKNEKDVLVFFLQSDEAIMMSKALCLLYESCEAKGWKHGREWGICAWNHDEFQCEVREDLVGEFRPLSENSIKNAGEFFNISVPHEGESDVGDNWYETH